MGVILTISPAAKLPMNLRFAQRDCRVAVTLDSFYPDQQITIFPDLVRAFEYVDKHQRNQRWFILQFLANHHVACLFTTNAQFLDQVQQQLAGCGSVLLKTDNHAPVLFMCAHPLGWPESEVITTTYLHTRDLMIIPSALHQFTKRLTAYDKAPENATTILGTEGNKYWISISPEQVTGIRSIEDRLIIDLDWEQHRKNLSKVILVTPNNQAAETLREALNAKAIRYLTVNETVLTMILLTSFLGKRHHLRIYGYQFLSAARQNHLRFSRRDFQSDGSVFLEKYTEEHLKAIHAAGLD